LAAFAAALFFGSVAARAGVMNCEKSLDAQDKTNPTITAPVITFERMNPQVPDIVASACFVLDPDWTGYVPETSRLIADAPVTYAHAGLH